MHALTNKKKSIVKQKASYPGHIRIIGGYWRGRTIPVLDRPHLRPTTNIARETLFNWLAPVIQNAQCLDCFTGSGALGLEALSRGAASVTFLEQDRAVSAQLKNNLRVLQTQQALVITVDSLYWLAQTGNAFDVVFIDPPFIPGMITATVAILEQHQRLADDAWIYIETATKEPTPAVPTSWQLYRKKFTVQVAYRLYRYSRHVTPDK